ncbi:hypothetical protein N2152v2_007966 [Parachlorella kessleri]
MGRRKTRPQANLGPVEQRLQHEAALDADAVQDGEEPPEDGDEAPATRPSKRQRGGTADPGDTSHVEVIVPLRGAGSSPAGQDQLRPFGSVRLGMSGSQEQLQQASSLRLWRERHGAEGGQEREEEFQQRVRLSMEANGPQGAAQGTLDLPSGEVVSALLELLRRGLLAASLAAGPSAPPQAQQAQQGRQMAPETAAAPAATAEAGNLEAGQGSIQDDNTTAPQPVSSCSLQLWLTERAFEECEVLWPGQTPRRRSCQLIKTLLLGWLWPELDPEHEGAAAASPGKTQQAQHGGATGDAGLFSPPLGSPPLSPRSPMSQRGAPFSPGRGHGAGAFDAAEVYQAVKPTGREPELAQPTPELLPTLRRYQRRAAHWMVARESGVVRTGAVGAGNAEGAAVGHQAQHGQLAALLHPLWRELLPWSAASAPAPAQQEQEQGSAAAPLAPCYVNPYSGALSRQRFEAPAPVRGGILCDEMGLGKTVELLACISAHKYLGPPPAFHALTLKRRRRQERIDCVCGVSDADAEDPEAEDYQGLWVQCDACDAWLHGACVGHPRQPPKGEFVCPVCLRAKAEVGVTQDCGASLIVCPQPILQQWHDEIQRHIRPGAMKVLIYHGQAQLGPSSYKHSLVTAADLAAADIVLTTYDVLKRDLYHNPEGDEAQKALRHRKKYEVIPTPLTRLRWWRVCLDEAQMVESTTAKAAEMALKLQTVHRWCVTGTPLSRGLEDIHGLMAFLKAEPWVDAAWWRRAIQQPYEQGSRAARTRLFALLRPSQGGLMWRSAKTDVADELALPPQHHELVSLQLNAIERHFYTRQHQDCVGKARAALPPGVLAALSSAAAADLTSRARGQACCDSIGTVDGAVEGTVPSAEFAATGTTGDNTVADRALTPQEERKLLDPLLRLRQACCHPQVGGGGIKSLVHQRAPMTMDEILEVLITKARTEAEESQRLLLAALNGIAGLLILQGQIPQAVAAYRETLEQVERTEGLVRADKLQQLHTLHNLAQLLSISQPPAAPAVPAGAGSVAINHAGSNNHVEGAGARLEGSTQDLAEECAGSGKGGGARTLRDAALVDKAQALREEYMAEPVARLAAAEHDMHEVESHMDKLRSQPLAGVALGDQRAELIDNWWVDAIILMTQETHDGGHHIADHIKTQLKEATTYLRAVSQNATSFSGRFRDLSGLQVLLQQETRELQRAQQAALEGLGGLSREVASPTSQLVEQAAQCGRCRAETGIPGRVCRHCRLEETFLRWEGRLFSLYAKAGAGAGTGGQVTAEEALQKAHQTTLNRVGRGGLGEAAGAHHSDGYEAHQEEAALLLGPAAGQLGSRRDGAVALTEIVRKPSEAENALRLLLHALRLLRLQDPQAAARKEVLAAAGKAQLDLLESARKLYLKARAVTLAQRAKLYALDELDMATMRLRLRTPGEYVREGEELYKIHEEEIPVRSTELSGDKAVAESELRRTLGTLRYLQGLKADRQRAAAMAAAAAAASPEPAAAAQQEQQEQGQPPDEQQQQQQPQERQPQALLAAQQQQAERGGQPGGPSQPGSPAERARLLQPPRTAAGVAAEARAAAAAAAADAEWRDFTAGAPLFPGLAGAAVPAAVAAASALSQGAVAATTAAGGAAGEGEPAGATTGPSKQQQQPQQQQEEVCPVCLAPLGEELSMLPCGHRLCCRCSMVLVERLPAGQPQASSVLSGVEAAKRIQCPTCRARVPVAEIAYVDARAAPSQPQDPGTAAASSGEAAIVVRGSYGTKH